MQPFACEAQFSEGLKAVMN